MPKGTGYFGRGRDVDAAVSRAQGKKKTKKKAVAKKKAKPRYRKDLKTGRYVQIN
jgi:hypothetical protein